VTMLEATQKGKCMCRWIGKRFEIIFNH
jgi:hypothetical protein